MVCCILFPLHLCGILSYALVEPIDSIDAGQVTALGDNGDIYFSHEGILSLRSIKISLLSTGTTIIESTHRHMVLALISGMTIMPFSSHPQFRTEL
jgi:hypothetical protein